MSDLVFLSTYQLVSGIRSRRFSAIEVLDAYLAHVAKHNLAFNAIVTGSTLEFLEQVGLSGSKSSSQSGKQSTGQLTEVDKPVSLFLLVEAIASRLSPPEPDLFASFRTLSEACQNRWLFSTSHLAQLLGRSSQNDW